MAEFRTGLEDKPWYYGLFVGLLVAAGIYGLMHVWQLRDQRRDLARKETQLASLQTQIQEGRAAEAQLPRFREEVRLLELELDKLLRVLPARRNTDDLLRRIRLLAEQGDFNLLRFRPGRFVDRDFYSEWPIAIALEGSYHNLALFFDRIGRFSRIINIEGLRVATYRGDDRDHSIAADFSAKTFVYKETPPPTPEEAPQ
ncbi:MAG: type 4a pilus biogenesis protein PilO [Thermoanaerobaculia bacterium]